KREKITMGYARPSLIPDSKESVFLIREGKYFCAFSTEIIDELKTGYIEFKTAPMSRDSATGRCKTRYMILLLKTHMISIPKITRTLCVLIFFLKKPFGSLNAAAIRAIAMVNSLVFSRIFNLSGTSVLINS